MTIDLAHIKTVPKPWGSLDLRSWNGRQPDGVAIGELWFQHAGPDPALLVKLLFTTAPLSIQVHPDDAFARSIGLPHGKTESWYIVSATPDAKVAVGLTRRLTASQLRVAIEDGSIAALVAWHSVKAGDFIFVPAGTIHALGAGLVVAEIQQNSDATFRMFDYGRKRELQVDQAVAVARAEPFAWTQSAHGTGPLTDNPFFVVERLELPEEGLSRTLHAMHETWLLVLTGSAQVGNVIAKTGECICMADISTSIAAGAGGRLPNPSHSSLRRRPKIIESREVMRPGILAREIPARSIRAATRRASRLPTRRSRPSISRATFSIRNGITRYRRGHRYEAVVFGRRLSWCPIMVQADV